MPVNTGEIRDLNITRRIISVAKVRQPMTVGTIELCCPYCGMIRVIELDVSRFA
jgi:hypothetical protein